jgi:cation:H+ antiporter
LIDADIIIAALEIIVGLCLLTKAADIFVDGSVQLASASNVSPVVVGVVVVGFGTSTPELLVSGIAAAQGNLALGVGNVVGSNVANISLVLATAALFVPILVTRPVLNREAPVALLSVLLFAFLTLGGLDRWEGVLLLVALAGVLGWIIFGGHEESVQVLSVDENATFGGSLIKSLCGLAGTVAGAELVLWGAEAAAAKLGLSEGFIGYTLVAVGTSLPELVTTINAARKRETELILGNLLGSNIFNSLAVGGIIAIIGPGVIEDVLLRSYGIVVMVLVATLAWIFMVARKRVSKIEAVILLVIYVLAILVLSELSIGTWMRHLIDLLLHG